MQLSRPEFELVGISSGSCLMIRTGVRGWMNVNSATGAPRKSRTKGCVCVISILVISNHNSFRVMFDKIAPIYFI